MILESIVPRRLLAVVLARLREEPVVVLEGPRTVGKTQLMQTVAGRLGVDVFDLDDPATRDAVRADATLFASAARRPVCFDEYQKAPGLLSAIKAELNRDLSPGRFLLAGSARHDAVPELADALTGRYHTVRVYPLSQGELAGVHESFAEAFLAEPAVAVAAAAGSETTREEYIERVVAGGFPIALARAGPARSRWFDDTIRASLERDLRDLAKLRQAALLPNLLERLAAQTAQVLNVSRAARETSPRSPIHQNTAESWIRLLEAVFLVDRLPAWGTTLRARAINSPKIHIVDSGVAARLLHLTPEKLAKLDPTSLTELGHLLETFAVWELRKQLSWLDGIAGVGHWRTSDGDEADLVVELDDGDVVAFEITAGASVPGGKFRGLKQLRDGLGQAFRGGAVLYLGSRSYSYDDRLFVVPLDRLWAAEQG
jgi:predicted AAA+ superfamily ATPase